MTSKKITATGITTYIKLIKSAKPYWKAFVLAIISLIIIAYTDALLNAKIAPYIVDEGFVARNPKVLLYAPIFIISLFLARGLGEFIRVYCMGYVGRNVVRDFRRKMLAHLMTLPSSFYDHHSQGELVSKVNYDTEQVSIAISDSVSDSLRGIFIAIAQLVVMFRISYQISLIVLASVPAMAMYFKYISKKMRMHSIKVQSTMGEVTHVAGEVIEGHQVIKSFNGESYEASRIYEVTENNKKQALRMCFASAISVPCMQVIGASVFALVVFFVLKYLVNITVGEVVGFITAMFMLLRPIKQISAVNGHLQRGIAAGDSIFSLLAEKPEINTGETILTSVKGRLEIQSVYFRYPKSEQDKYVLNNISFTVNAGKTCAIVGASGSGKSSLVSLLPRFYELTGGKILLDGIDISQLELKNLRSMFAIVTQHVILFNDTIYNNIAYAKPDATEIEVIEAAKAAHAYEFIEKLPKQLQTNIGDNGVLLSGGQRQRIAIARAILKNAPILVLDEATSAIDPVSEHLIKSALDNLRKNKTTIVIAHRLSTIENADQILVLENGKIVEMGTHDELLEKNNNYSALQRIKFN
jgi:ATP-binding cassette, subfamily B, bacterial MsbA